MNAFSSFDGIQERDAWLKTLSGMAGRHGFFQPVGAAHSALHIRKGKTLLVGFESIGDILTGNPGRRPQGLDLVEAQGWSYLGLFAHDGGWYRDPAIYAFFDHMIDDDFFDEFDQVVFFGAGPGGYAACAYSVVAPGARVLAIAPQATLDTTVAGWDDRFPAARRLDFNSRYGYAPDMLDAADRAVLIYDPAERLDAMHAALFRESHVLKLRCRFTGDALMEYLGEMGLIGTLLEHVAAGTLTPARFGKLYRARRDHLPYLRHFAAKLHLAERPYLLALCCESILRRIEKPFFFRYFRMARQELSAAGSAPPPTRLFPAIAGLAEPGA